MIEFILEQGAIVLWSIAAVWLFVSTFLFYVMITHVLKVRRKLNKKGEKLHWLVVALVIPWLILGAISNTLLNIIVMTVVCLDPPHLHKGEFFTTTRMQRYRAGDKGLIKLSPLVRWRRKVADMLCERVLNPFDGGHC